MKWIKCIILLHFVFVPFSNAQEKATISHNELFGNPPDSVPVVFARGIISLEDRYEYGLAISPDYREIFFTAEAPAKGLSVMKRLENGYWKAPQTANLRANGSWEFEAFYSTDGSKLYFSSDVNDTSRLWCATRSSSGWNAPFFLESPVNSTPVFWATFSRNNTMYYTNLSVFQIYKSKLFEGRYKETERAGLAFGLHPFISPDEDFLLFNGKGDIYIAFRTKEGKWSEPIKIGNKINTTEYDETCPSLSPDGKFIFFSRYNDRNGKSDIYWASSSIIDSIREKMTK
jgi:hypothetical protein